MSRRVSNILSRRIGKIVIVGIIISLILAGLLIAASVYDKNHDEFQGVGDMNVGDRKTIEYDGQTYVYRDGIETVLIVGLDAFGKAVENDSYNNDRQADFLVLLVIDRIAEKTSAIHISRDTMTDVPMLGITGQQVGITNQQISLSHTYGNGGLDSCHNVAVTVSRMMFDLPIDSYVSLTMDGIKELNDLVGGVTLIVLDDFSGVDNTLVKGETVTLMGDHALNYVRSRNNLEDSTNERRMVRQRQYMEALYSQGRKYAEENEKSVVDAVSKLNDYIVSNCSVSQIDELFSKISKYEFTEIKTIEGELIKGEKYMEFYYDEEALKKLVVDTFYSAETK